MNNCTEFNDHCPDPCQSGNVEDLDRNSTTKSKGTSLPKIVVTNEECYTLSALSNNSDLEDADNKDYWKNNTSNRYFYSTKRNNIVKRKASEKMEIPSNEVNPRERVRNFKNKNKNSIVYGSLKEPGVLEAYMPTSDSLNKNITNYIKRKLPEAELRFEELKVKAGEYRSFKVSVRAYLSTKIIDSNFWPRSIVVKKFTPKRKSQKAPVKARNS
ncbi:hypothetical protein HHI36_013197 [Cryptolaemus montrouzieri]|uniref:Uncharacterized protein n=1 Tax=Cryptolaemus montrouzieri TaxID=559131 RepID=A0ABD2NHT7_9CUCU